MPDDPAPLRLATRDEIALALSYALRFDGGRRFGKASELMAQITAAHLIEHLELSGFVVMKKPPGPAHGRF